MATDAIAHFLNNHLKSYIDNSPLGKAICRFFINDYNQKDYKILYANRLFQKYLLIKQEEYMIKSILEMNINYQITKAEFIEQLYIDLIQKPIKKHYIYDDIREKYYKVLFFLYKPNHFAIQMEDITEDKLKEHEFSTAISERNEQLILAIANLKTEIQKRQEIEQKLSDEKILLKNILESSPVAITMVDERGKITYANKKAEEVLALDKKEITSRNYNDPQWKIESPEGGEFPQDQLPFHIVKTTLEPVSGMRHAIVSPSGERKILKIAASPILNDQGKFTGMVSHIEDITGKMKL